MNALASQQVADYVRDRFIATYMKVGTFQIIGDRKGREERVLLGVNARDLDTLQVIPNRLTELAPKLASGVPHVAESGVGTPDDAAALVGVGYQVALIGTALMSTANPRALLAEMLKAARAAKK